MMNYPSDKKLGDRPSPYRESLSSRYSNDFVEPQENFSAIRTSNDASPYKNMDFKSYHDSIPRPRTQQENTKPTGYSQIHNQTQKQPSTSNVLSARSFNMEDTTPGKGYHKQGGDLNTSGTLNKRPSAPTTDQKLTSSPGSKTKAYDPRHVFYEVPGKSQIKFKQNSKTIMQKVFDTDFSASSPSKKKMHNMSLQEKKDAQGFDQSHLTVQKLSLIQEDPMLSKTLEKIDHFDILSHLDFPFLEKSYQAFLDYLKGMPETNNASLSELLLRVCDELRNSYEEIRAGAAIYLFELISENADNVTYDQMAHILSQIFENLPVYHEADEAAIMVVCIEIIAFVGPHSVSFSNIKMLSSLLADDTKPLLQEKAFQALQRLDYPGLQALLEATSREFNDLPLFILNKLAQCPEIQASIIVPALINEFSAIDSKRRTSALAAMNRMYGAISRGGAVPALVNLMQEGSLDRLLIASALLASGELGEQALLKFLKSSSNPKIRAAVCGVLPWRITGFDKVKLKIVVIPYQVSQHYQHNPGTMCIYYGSLKPLSQVEIEEGPQQEIKDVIEVNTRDFTAALQRLLTLKYKNFSFSEGQFSEANLDKSILTEYSIYQFLTQQLEKQPEQPGQIPTQIVRALMAALGDQVASVREAAVNAIGLIGLPEASDAVEGLIKALYDQEAQVRATAAWAIGKLGSHSTQRAHKRLLELLKDQFWKVRTASCVALGYVGNPKDPQLYQSLVRILRDGTINKLTVCDTLVRLGSEGEQILLDILKNTPNSNYVLKAAIIQSLELADVEKPTIDFVIEELFRNSGDQMLQVRKACLATLEKLRVKAQNNNITYLKPKNILPLFYYFLQDGSNQIREMALSSIHSFGPQGELMLIEGLTKDKNPQIRAECAKGLALFGPHTFRAMIFGLRDVEDTVRNATAAAMKKYFTPQAIIDEYRDKHHQKPAIICSLREIINHEIPLSYQSKEFLEDILNYFQGELNATNNDTTQPFSPDYREAKYVGQPINENEFSESKGRQSLLKNAGNNVKSHLSSPEPFMEYV